MHPLQQLRKLLQDHPTNSGTVIAIHGNSLTLATRQGSRQVQKQSADATVYRPGDAVILANGQIVGRKTREPSIYVV